jgi:hypothetical protein
MKRRKNTMDRSKALEELSAVVASLIARSEPPLEGVGVGVLAPRPKPKLPPAAVAMPLPPPEDPLV